MCPLCTIAAAHSSYAEAPGAQKRRLPMQDLRLVPIAVGALAGALCGLRLPLSSGAARAALALIAVLGLVAIVATKGAARSEISTGRACITVVLLTVAVTSTSWIISAYRAELAHPAIVVRAAQEHRRVSIEGTIASRVSSATGPWDDGECTADVSLKRVTIRSIVYPVSEQARVVVIGVPCEAMTGQDLRAVGPLSTVEGTRRQVARLRSSDAVLSGEGRMREAFALRVKAALGDLLADKPTPVRQLVPGVVLGDRAQMNASLRDAMQVVQLSHLTAVSGAHVAVITGTFIAILGRRRAVLSAVLSMLALCGLVILVGGQASVVRAALMSALIFVALALERPAQAVAALCVSVIVGVLLNPWLATSYGFLLSTSATAGIVLAGSPLAAWLAERIPRLVAEAIAIPLTAQLACLPVLLLFADSGSIWGVVANCLVAPVVAPLTISGMASALLAVFVPALASLILLPAQMASWWIWQIATCLAGWPGSGVPLWMASLGSVLIVAGVMGLVLILRGDWCGRRGGGGSRVALAVVVLGALAICILVGQRRTPGGIPSDWTVVQCDVGQGSGLIARSHGRTLMIDVGPETDAAAQCLKQADVEHLDLLVLSHAHSDHIGGLAAVLDQAEVEQVWVSPNTEPAANSAWALRQLEEAGVPVYTASAGTQLEGTDGMVAAAVLWPRTTRGGGEEAANHQSIALWIDAVGGVLVLSDMDESAQSTLARDAPVVTTVVVAHHGSADQSARLADVLSARLALVSVGENSYGHPSQRVLELYAESDIYSTKDCGTITLDARGGVSSACSAPIG
ncbi:ComEC/Rec2 family competence protein [Actinobaculum sp. 313]|uniref:ComEC/Rec2 family competence protein n=1 Tax=Actinobaculum sp. 313 TaxID=2495645 RepID=UPI000D52908D|nr:ComEC/Rec2 family competence protein [Actinobaculum sp. 313]AWE42283.1 hypothetical protein DDD63_05445 [Actinobaculum sp. 313]